MATFADLARILLGQWQDSPRLRGIVTDIIVAARDDGVTSLEAMAENMNLDTAQGVWLDRIGGVLGLPRPSTTRPSDDPRWGFTGPAQSRGFDLAPFSGDTASAALFPLPDAVYRRLLRARGRLVVGDGTFATWARAVLDIAPGSTVVDDRDMTVTVVSDRQDLLELADSVGALPRSAGVRVRYRDRERWGYDSAGVPFDQGPFA